MSVSKSKKKETASAGPSWGGIGDAAVRAKTGKGWNEWFAILDRVKAHEWKHKEIAAHLSESEHVGPWWAQMVTVGYEQARGLRLPHQKPDGFAASASKTFAVSVTRLFDSWANSASRRAWLGPAKLTVRKATKPKSVRITWADGSSVNATFTSKESRKSHVAVDHAKLSSARDVKKMKAMWRAAFERLAEHLES